MKHTLYALVFLFGLTTLPTASLAQETKQEETKQEQSKEDEKQEDEKKEEKKNPDVEKYEKAIKDAKKFEGAFTFYTKDNSILLELPEDNLDKLFLIQGTLHSGIASIGGQAGDPLGTGAVDVFRWVREGEHVSLVRPRTKYQWDPYNELAVSAERSFPEAYLSTFKIEQKHPEQKLLLLNVTNLFQGVLFELPQMVSASIGGTPP